MAEIPIESMPEIDSPSLTYTRAMEHLVGVVQALSQARDVGEVAAIVRNAARSLTGADGATFVLRDGNTCYYADESAIAPLWKGKRFPMEMCVSGWVMLNQQAVTIPDIYQDARVPAEAYRPTFVKSLAMVPIRRAAPIGAIGNYWAVNRTPTDEEIAILQALADTTSVALENIQLYETLREKVRTLEAQQARIQAQHESLEVFTRALAHDLREPVRTVRSFSDLIVEGGGTPETRPDYFDFIRKAADRMAMLVDTVFLYTQLDDPSRLVRQPCDMNDMVQAAKENLAQLIIERGVAVTSDPLPKVAAHPTHMMQVLQNLIANAIHHGPEGVEVHISAKKVDGVWQFSVRDNGPGIAADDTARIFQPFKRLNQNEEGAGLGLPLCRKIISLHGGRIWCESTVGKGANFIFSLPPVVDREKPDRNTDNWMTQDTLAIDSSAHEKLANVLLVDDRKSDVELTRVFLQVRDKMKFNLSVANGAREALEALKQARSRDEKIDLLLLDINMPGMDGFEMLEKLQADESLKHVAVIMCTGSTYDQDQMRARELGASGYMVKPASLAQLKPMLEAIPALKLQGDGESVQLMRAA
ncbi:hybrid sensor histidine kinase/response regulator [Asticcacaulis sp. 201]|uniref:hybrid sensor histidine kinase/response regulator n=1 Tax=Asticcacaulis sp. 201 TaxID=3028787 RepID=UPI0029163CA1|nr:hybrid sensor histidine kinase/response regulator [Asticcacaulis sp. 201]MDV6332921.1 hybrid sensor histidine kinase/response regulator [Asticcacaulis sp. 201]